MMTASSEARLQPSSNPPGASTRQTWINHALCVILSMVFLAAAIAKTMSFRELEATLAASKLVPVLLTTQIGILLVATEYLLALLLLLPQFRKPALLVATGLVSVFVGYTTWRWMQGIAVPCHCFGVLFKLEPWQSLGLNLGLLALIIRVKSQDRHRG